MEHMYTFLIFPMVVKYNYIVKVMKRCETVRMFHVKHCKKGGKYHARRKGKGTAGAGTGTAGRKKGGKGHMEGKDRTEINETGTGTAETGTGGKTGGSTSTSRKERGSAGTGTGSTGTGTATATENKEGEKVPQVVTVNVPEEKPKKKRTVKKKTQPKKEETGLSSAMVSDLIVGCSQVVATKPENAHWSIDKKEADQIAVPLVKVIEKNENLKKVAEHSDTVALVMACVMVFAPRAYISMNMAKEKKARKKHAIVNEVKQNDRETEKIERGSRTDNKRNADAGTNVSPSISELLSV